MPFQLTSSFNPAGGQPNAIKQLTEGYAKFQRQTLLGITGSGKTFVVANLIQNVQKPTLVLAHNKTLAAQLYQELKELFPENRVEYFISYYDYYQPESYMPTTDTYIEKEATVNAQIERLRLRALTALRSRSDVIIVASISCIYAAGNPLDFSALAITISKGKSKQENIIASLIDMQYQRNDLTLEPGNFRVKGETMDIYPPYDERIIRVEFYGDEVERIQELDSLTLEPITTLNNITIFPAKQFVVPEDKTLPQIPAIIAEMKERIEQLPPLEAQRLQKKVLYDMEMIKELGYCSGIENYSRYFDGRKEGQPPYCLLNHFPDDFLLVIDESHQSIPQSHAMYKGDYSRKKNLVDYGFRLPSAFDNRPLKFNEFEQYFKHTLFVSATPSKYETESSGQVVELIIRPTGLVDPLIEIQPIKGHIQHLMGEIQKTVAKQQRVLVTTLTKRMAQDLTDYLAKEDIRVRYLHSDIESLDRIEIIRGLRAGEFDVLVGINLLREGLDLPEVSLVAILDADKESFLRDERSLIQTIGRAARNSEGRVIMYADVMTKSMKGAIDITNARREQQILFNKKHKITPHTIIKSVAPKQREVASLKHMSSVDVQKKIAETEAAMKRAAEELDFEKAIALRDLLKEMERMQKEGNY